MVDRQCIGFFAMKLSRTVVYALQATIQLAESNTTGPTPCSKLAAEGGMPERFLLQILRSLVTHGILQSTRGVDGGYALVKSPEEVSVLEIMEAIEGPMTSSFPTTEHLDDSSRVRLDDALREVASTARRQLDAIKLSQLVEPAHVETL